MANHGGSYMLREILDLLEREKVFEFLGKEKTHHFLQTVVRRSIYGYDCVAREILNGFSSRFGLCEACYQAHDDLKGGLCPGCR
jgi:hypothetical protein